MQGDGNNAVGRITDVFLQPVGHQYAETAGQCQAAVEFEILQQMIQWCGVGKGGEAALKGGRLRLAVSTEGAVRALAGQWIGAVITARRHRRQFLSAAVTEIQSVIAPVTTQNTDRFYPYELVDI